MHHGSFSYKIRDKQLALHPYRHAVLLSLGSNTHLLKALSLCCFLSYPAVHVHPRLQSWRWTMRSMWPLKLTTPASRRKPNPPQCSSTSPCTPSESQTWICARPGKPLCPPGIAPHYPPRNHISIEMGTCFSVAPFELKALPELLANREEKVRLTALTQGEGQGGWHKSWCGDARDNWWLTPRKPEKESAASSRIS